MEEIYRYIAQDSEKYAVAFAKKICAIVESLLRFPRSGRMVPEYGEENLREKIYQNYRIVYRFKEDVIEIVAICHGSRPLKNLL